MKGTSKTMTQHKFLNPKTPYSIIISTIKYLFIIFSIILLSSSNIHALLASSSSSPNNVDYFLSSQILPNNNNNNNNNEHEISEFRKLNRRHLTECSSNNPYIQIDINSVSPISDDQNITITVSGVSQPSDEYWVAMISPSHSSVEQCPLNTLLYKETGDFSDLPLLCHYPVKAAYLKNDPNFMSCKKSECKKQGDNGDCMIKTCNASLVFHVINFRTDIEFVLFDNGFQAPCILKRSKPLPFASPNKPLYGHISSVSSSATSMRVTWVSGSAKPQEVQYGNGKSTTSTVATFTQDDMCGSLVKSPAEDFGWHDPGYIHTSIMTDLKPSTNFFYKYGSGAVGWSDEIEFRTPPAGGSNELTFLAYGDMGKAPRDSTVEHYIQPGSLSVVDAITEEVASGKVDSIFHIGDISYATGFLVEWDYFLHLITPLASKVSYMTAIGNHERDYIDSGSVYVTPDSGGECGVPYESYFQMPISSKDKPWYSIEQGPVHFTVISTEHNWRPDSEQYNWMKSDMASVDRNRTPWLIFTGHRPMYTSANSALISVDQGFVQSVEPLLIDNKVDLVMFGHVHNYERTCAIYKGKCMAKPVKDENAIDTYDNSNSNYTAPVQTVIGMAGFTLDDFSLISPHWSLKRIHSFGYSRIQATREELSFEFVESNTRQVKDSFRIIK